MLHEKLYRSDDLANIAFRDYAEDLGRSLVATLSGDPDAISFELESCEARFPADTLIALGLVMNELITNSLKHAFKDGRRGRIRVSLAVEGEDFILESRDDGEAPADEKLITESESLGWTLVKGLVRQLGGTLRLDLRGGTGTIIRFPRSTALEGAVSG
jgi:two-component sensor histidine kinase